MRSVLEGVPRAYFVNPIGPGLLQATAKFAHAAKEAGVDSIVNVPELDCRDLRFAS
jgi:NAD(P)H dehydrogenase (quinone)